MVHCISKLLANFGCALFGVIQHGSSLSKLSRVQKGASLNTSIQGFLNRLCMLDASSRHQVLKHITSVGRVLKLATLLRTTNPSFCLELNWANWESQELNLSLRRGCLALSITTVTACKCCLYATRWFRPQTDRSQAKNSFYLASSPMKLEKAWGRC